MNITTTDISITGCLFAKDKIQDPIKYVRGVFKNPQNINILKTSGRMMMFRVTEFYDNENGFDFTDIIKGLTYDPPVSITYELNFSTRVKDEDRWRPITYLEDLS